MTTLRQMVDGAKAVFDATVGAHNRALNPQYGRGVSKEVRAQQEEVNRQVAARADAVALQASTAGRAYERSHAQEINRYVYEIAAMGQRMQEEYQRGYRDGFGDGVRAGAVKPEPRKIAALGLQGNRDVALDE